MKIQEWTIVSILLIFVPRFTYGITRRTDENEHRKQKIFTTVSRRSGQIRFEDQYSDSSNEPDNLGASNQGFKFEDDAVNYGSDNSGRITFQDDNGIENIDRPVQPNPNDVKLDTPGTKKRKRRRRRPRYQRPNSGFPANHQYPGAVPGYPGPGSPGVVPPYPAFGPVNPNGQYYKPPRRPKPSFASEALTAVTGALTSIALYDDYQCVPRLLCEAAGGGALGSSGVLQSVAGLQPLLTLLSAYNGISSSPLFVFGRAVFLGMTTKGNAASCRYAYPQCPTDPEQLVHYLNNHNGGFFRFFNSPQQNNQNVDQFYQQLSSQGQYGLQYPQNFGVHDPNFPQNPQDLFYQQQQGQQNLQNYGQNQPFNQPGSGFQQNPNGNQNPPHYGLYNPQLYQYPQNYGLLSPQYPNIGSPNTYPSNGYGYLQNYGKKYPYNNKYGFNKIRYKDNGDDENKIQRRIQNKPNYEYVDSNIEALESDDRLKLPHINRERENDVHNNRGSKTLKFPEEIGDNRYEQINKRKVKAISFPQPSIVRDDNNDCKKITNEYLNHPSFNIRETALSNYIKYFNYYHGVVNNNENYKTNDFDKEEEGLQTVYVVRGNGDPNHPEIVKIRPGEQVH